MAKEDRPKLATRRGGMRFAWAAVRSGLRRYPGELLRALVRGSPPQHANPRCLKHITRHRLAAAWLGHGSVLASLGGCSLLVDPVFSSRIGVRFGGRTFGPLRLAPPPVATRGLPPLDVILITHAHFDHLDRPTLGALAHPRTTVVTARGTRKLIPQGFRQVVELEPQDTFEIGGVRLRAYSPAHWGARRVTDRHRGCNSYLASSRAGRVLFAGDTAHTHAFDDCRNLDLAVFGIGAYNPWEHMHATPEQVWSMFERQRAAHLLPVHHSTFELSDEPVDEPMRRLWAAAGAESHRVVDLPQGDVWSPRR